ncbi:MAG: caspase family protein [Bacteroidota bacterium]
MKKATIFVVGSLFALASTAYAQNVSTRTSEFEIDFSDPTKLVTSTIPVINWITPVAETTYAQENKYKIKFEIESGSPIKNITISIKEGINAASRGTQTIQPDPSQNLHPEVEKSLTLLPGENVLEIVAENDKGVKTISYKTVHVGSTGLADAAKLDRTDYALVFATDQYDNWPDLVNPVFDARTIAEELRKTYGFKVEIIENATQNDILKKLRDYIEKKYKPLDQLFIFFAGHGNYDATFGEGYLVPREALTKDEAKTSYLSYNRLRSVVNNIPCEHIFLTMDVCFGGTFDQTLASSRGLEADEYKEKSAAEFITQKLTYKTRKFLTSGGKQYVSDGIPGKHSPFARALIEALRSKGGRDGILTLSEITPYVEKLKITPRAGEFGDNAPGSDFVFVAR